MARIWHEQQEDETGEAECRRGEHCQSAERVRGEDGITRRYPALGPRAFCDPDAAIIGSCLRSMPDWHSLLGRMLGTRVTAEVTVRMPFGPSLELRCDVDEIMRCLADAAMTWLERVAALPGIDLSLPYTRTWHEQALGPRAGRLVAYAAVRLAERITALISLGPDISLRPPLVAAAGCGEQDGTDRDSVWLIASGADAGSEFLRLDYLARAALGLTRAPADDLLGVACPHKDCGRQALRRADPPQHPEDTEYFAVCGTCGHLLTESEFRWQCRYLTRFYRNKITPAVAASAGYRSREDALAAIA